MKQLLINWKTSSAGILSIIAGLTRIGFAITSKQFNEEVVMTSTTTILGGVGLLCARDVNVTSTDLGLQTSVKKADAKTVVTDTPTN